VEAISSAFSAKCYMVNGVVVTVWTVPILGLDGRSRSESPGWRSDDEKKGVRIPFRRLVAAQVPDVAEKREERG